MSLTRLTPQAWTPLAQGCWALGPQDVDWKNSTPPAATSVLLQGSAGCWLIDCGAGERRHELILQAPVRPTHLLCTHAHPDHSTHLDRWAHVPRWMSHANPESWIHEQYVRAHWDQYLRESPLAAQLPRNLVAMALPHLEASLEGSEEQWDAAVRQAILESGRVFYGHAPDFMKTTSLESLSLQPMQIGNELWQGWKLGELWVFPSRGHAPDQVVAWWEPQQLWILSDETSAAPVWTDSDQMATLALQRKVLRSLQESTILVGGHQSFSVSGLKDCQQFLQRLIDLGETLQEACRRPGSIEELYRELSPHGWMQPFLRGQFPQGLFFAKQFLHNWRLMHGKEYPS
jgi:glyoxylase-like metal-dependent hydrolase (beta-lactamase superfamily II)